MDSNRSHWVFKYTVKPVLSSHSKIDKTKILTANGSLMMVESIAEYSLPWSILQYVWPAINVFKNIFSFWMAALDR